MKKINVNEYATTVMLFTNSDFGVFCMEAVVAHYSNSKTKFLKYLEHVQNETHFNAIEKTGPIYTESWLKKMVKFTKAMLGAVGYDKKRIDIFVIEFLRELEKRLVQ